MNVTLFRTPPSESLALESFARAYVGGLDQEAAAVEAGFPATAARALLYRSDVRAMIRAERAMQLGNGANLALAFMVGLVKDPAAETSDRFRAAKWLLESAGHGLAAARVAVEAESARSLADLVAAAGARPAIDGEAADVS